MSPGDAVDQSEDAEAKRLDRELNELLQELRVVQGGILLLVGFLLIIPFTTGFEDVTTFQRDVYYLTLVAAGTAAIVIIAPVSHHRLAFRRHDKHAVVMRGNVVVIAGLALVGLAILGVLVLVTDYLFSGTLTAIMSALYILLVIVLWYALPMHSLRRLDRSEAAAKVGATRSPAGAP